MGIIPSIISSFFCSKEFNEFISSLSWKIKLRLKYESIAFRKKSKHDEGICFSIFIFIFVVIDKDIIFSIISFTIIFASFKNLFGIISGIVSGSITFIFVFFVEFLFEGNFFDYIIYYYICFV